MKKTFAAALAFVAISSIAQAHDEPAPAVSTSTLLPTLVRIRDAAVASDYAYRATAALTLPAVSSS